MKKRTLCLLLALCMTLCLAACSGGQKTDDKAEEKTEEKTESPEKETEQAPEEKQEEPEEKKEIEHPKSIVICASTAGNSWYSSAVKLSELMMKEWPDMSVTVIEGGGDANIDLVNGGQDAQLGFTSSTSIIPALAGTNDQVTDASNVVPLMSVSVSYAQTAVLASSDIMDYSDLAGKRMAAGTYGQVAMYTSDALLEAYGMSAKDLEGGDYQIVSPSEYPDQFADGHLDACHINGNLPLATLVQIDSVTPIRILQPSREAIDYILEKYPSFYEEHVEAGYYEGQTEALDLLAYDGMLIANKDLNEDFLARIVEIVCDANEAGELADVQSVFGRAYWANCGVFITEDNTLPAVYEMIQSHQ